MRSASRLSLGEMSTDEHSPFLQGLLRYSPHNLSPAMRSSRGPPRRFFSEPVQDGIPVDELRQLVQQSILDSPSQASFYASLLYSKTGLPSDALLLARTHFQSENHPACLRTLEESRLLQSDNPWEALLLACQSFGATQEWTTLVDLLEDACRLPDTSVQNTLFRTLSQPLEDDDSLGWQSLQSSITVADHHRIHPLARVCWWRGQAYQETGHASRAALFYQRALRIDGRMQQAWEALLAKHLITPLEAYQLVQALDFFDKEWLKQLYLSRIEVAHGSTSEATTSSLPALDASSIHFSSPPLRAKTPGAGVDFATSDKETESSIQKDLDGAFDKLWNEFKLQRSPHVLAMAARRAHRRYQWKEALGYCNDLAQLDPTLGSAAYAYVSTLVILGQTRVLFRIAHEWVQSNPQSAQGWFAVGAYYYACERYHVAQRHFCRATRLEPQCSEAWIGFGCAFAASDESDQALASFRAAQRLSPGEHSSLLYMGMEYVRTNHLVLAEHFLTAANKSSLGDPLCLHELGVLAANRKDHDVAIDYFQKALKVAMKGDTWQESVELCSEPYWEPTIFNLGHSLRKQRKLEDAELCYSRCTALYPDRHSAYAALGFVRHLLGNVDSAISCYHQALGIKHDDPFSSEMLEKALRESLASLSFGDDTDENQNTTMASPPLRKYATPASSRKVDSSAMSEDMDSDVDMSAG